MRPTCSSLLVHAARAFALIAVALVASACDDETSCDANQRLERGVCYPRAVDAAPPASMPDAAAADTSAPAGPTFGDPCTKADHSECLGAVVDTCAIPPGQTAGYCTLRFCDSKPMCAAGYTCTNVGVLLGNPALPWVCVRN